ncbi:hypothetical protein CJ177_44635 [Rhodococcus sp. ACPA1]|nr:hypothetical protein CJ177_44635 [Rhodococcus sp. ACPA1]
MNPADNPPPRASRLHRAEDLLPLAATAPATESDTARRKKLIFAPGLSHDALARRWTVRLDPTTETPAGDTQIVRLGPPHAEPE